MSVDLRHGKADVNGTRLHYVSAGAGEPLLLLHGFPQTWYEWRHVLPVLAERYTVIAPDYRGAGDSARPVDGYDKATMAADVVELADHLVPGARLRVVGHDMGAFVAYSVAAHFPDRVRALCLVDAPVPGTRAWDGLRTDPRVWHIAFHGARDVAEMLVAGRERQYLAQFFELRAHHPHLVMPELDVYLRTYAAPGGMRAAFEAYRALPHDAEVNAELLGTPLRVPVLVVAGERSNSGPLLEAMGPQISRDASFALVRESGHWIPEEQPEAFLAVVEPFLARA
ncbi:alpha/beta fold hydrolase [Pseudonocardia sp. KRD291]|uniref:alpha/beta fold hydrolase n=1 Tax=Pseudonocardia sp. KRD291 TaxID=2792007 RepID=UPI001C49ED05|nr:alpha/beta hydrolase [Pseudonocardia sp. KRD291]MBW0103461.1 alpha/beta hydrolase [Pseudonocardia sp. KRD291]